MNSHSTLTFTDVHSTATPQTPTEPCLIIATCCHRPTMTAARVRIGDLSRIELGRGPARELEVVPATGGPRARMALADPWMSGDHAVLSAQAGTWYVEDAGSKNGTRLNGADVRRAPLDDGDVIEVGGTFVVFDASAPRDASPQRCIDLDDYADLPRALVTLDARLARQFAGLRRIAPTDVPVIITGDSGTGKELTARALHELSDRDGPLVAVNCGAIPDPLVESVLFGHARGAFSGATEARPGLIRSAAGGTLFLDEVAELPEPSQVALLRFLQEGEVRSVGDTDVHRVDVRIVAATHQDLKVRVEQGQFRRDLYGRLAGYRVRLPALCRRKQDLGLLIRTLLRDIAGDDAPSVRFRASAMRALFQYDFPLNIRELHHVLRSALLMADDAPIARSHLPDAIMRKPRGGTPRPLSPEDAALRQEVSDLLAEHRGNVSAVARAMGKAPVQIRRWCRRLDIDLQRFRK